MSGSPKRCTIVQNPVPMSTKVSDNDDCRFQYKVVQVDFRKLSLSLFEKFSITNVLERHDPRSHRDSIFNHLI